MLFFNKSNNQDVCAVRGLWNVLVGEGDPSIDRFQRGSWGYYHARYWFRDFNALRHHFSIHSIDNDHVVVFAHGNRKKQSIASISHVQDIDSSWFVRGNQTFNRALLFVCYCDEVFFTRGWRTIFPEWVGFRGEFRLRLTVDEYNRMYKLFFKKIFVISSKSISAKSAFDAIGLEFENLYEAMIAIDAPDHEARVAFSFIEHDRHRMVFFDSTTK